MSNIPSFDDLPPLDCPLTIQPKDNMCIGDLVKLLTYNTMVLERTIIGRSVPSGVVSYYAGSISDIPSGYLICDGSRYKSNNYPTLAKKLGNLHGWVDSSVGCFHVPDLMKTVVIGADISRNIDGTRDVIDDESEWEYTPYTPSPSPVSPQGGTNPNAAGSFNFYRLDKDTSDPLDTSKQLKTRFTMLIPIISTGEVCSSNT